MHGNIYCIKRKNGELYMTCTGRTIGRHKRTKVPAYTKPGKCITIVSKK